MSQAMLSIVQILKLRAEWEAAMFQQLEASLVPPAGHFAEAAEAVLVHQPDMQAAESSVEEHVQAQVAHVAVALEMALEMVAAAPAVPEAPHAVPEAPHAVPEAPQAVPLKEPDADDPHQAAAVADADQADADHVGPDAAPVDDEMAGQAAGQAAKKKPSKLRHAFDKLKADGRLHGIYVSPSVAPCKCRNAHKKYRDFRGCLLTKMKNKKGTKIFANIPVGKRGGHRSFTESAIQEKADKLYEELVLAGANGVSPSYIFDELLPQTSLLETPSCTKKARVV